MTDLPRRSYPLVVSPPGGFEDAVRRGRKLRRRRTSGTSGAALMLVGALGYSLLGHGSGVDSINTTDTPPDTGRGPVPSAGTSYVPGPGVTASPSAATGRSGTSTVAAGSRGGVPTAGPTAVKPPTRPPGTVTRRFAKRPVIKEDPPSANTGLDCLQQQAQDGWCTFAMADDTSAVEGGPYTLSYYVCRQVGTSAGTLDYDREQRVDFVAIDKKNNDTVWTYSAGKPVVHEPSSQTISPGYCVRWSTEWDGLDDFGYTPPKGTYTLVASSFATGPRSASTEFLHQ